MNPEDAEPTGQDERAPGFFQSNWAEIAAAISPPAPGSAEQNKNPAETTHRDAKPRATHTVTKVKDSDTPGGAAGGLSSLKDLPLLILH